MGVYRDFPYRVISSFFFRRKCLSGWKWSRAMLDTLDTLRTQDVTNWLDRQFSPWDQVKAGIFGPLWNAPGSTILGNLYSGDTSRNMCSEVPVSHSEGCGVDLSLNWSSPVGEMCEAFSARGLKFGFPFGPCTGYPSFPTSCLHNPRGKSLL